MTENLYILHELQSEIEKGMAYSVDAQGKTPLQMIGGGDIAALVCGSEPYPTDEPARSFGHAGVAAIDLIHRRIYDAATGLSSSYTRRILLEQWVAQAEACARNGPHSPNADAALLALAQVKSLAVLAQSPQLQKFDDVFAMLRNNPFRQITPGAVKE